MINDNLFHLIGQGKKNAQILGGKLIKRNNVLLFEITTDQRCISVHLPDIVLRISYNLLHVTSNIKLLKCDDDRLIGHPLLSGYLRLALLFTEFAKESLYDAVVIYEYSGDQQ